jgi:hypothetical protein
MTWFRVDDRLPDHRKTRKAGTAAMGLWVLAGAWSSGHLTDGWVPRAVALRYGNARLAERLVTAELWVVGELDGEPGWWFHEWTDHQPTREQVQRRRKADAKRQAKRRGNEDSSDDSTSVDSLWTDSALAGQESVSRRDSRVTHAVSHGAPDPTRPVPTSPNGEVSAPDGLDFAAFYAAYPRHTGRKEAERKWLKAVKDGAAPADLLAGAKRYAATRQGQDQRYTAHPATWLHQGRWMDEPELRLVSNGYQPYRDPEDQSVYDEEM